MTLLKRKEEAAVAVCAGLAVKGIGRFLGRKMQEDLRLSLMALAGAHELDQGH